MHVQWFEKKNKVVIMSTIKTFIAYELIANDCCACWMGLKTFVFPMKFSVRQPCELSIQQK